MYFLCFHSLINSVIRLMCLSNLMFVVQNPLIVPKKKKVLRNIFGSNKKIYSFWLPIEEATTSHKTIFESHLEQISRLDEFHTISPERGG